MLDEKTQNLCEHALLLSRAQAITYAEALDQMGLLMTEAKRKSIRAEPLGQLAVMLAAETPERVVRWFFNETRPVSAAEMFYAVMAWLSDCTENILKSEVSDA